MTGLADQLDDETIQLAIGGIRRLLSTWSSLPFSGTLRLERPLARSAGEGGTDAPG